MADIITNVLAIIGAIALAANIIPLTVGYEMYCRFYKRITAAEWEERKEQKHEEDEKYGQ